MTTIFTIGIFATAVFEVSGSRFTDLSVRYSSDMFFNGYYSMPKTVTEIEKEIPQEFVKVNHDNELNVDVYSHPNDPRFFLLFDTYGNIAGIRTGYIKKDITRLADERCLEFPYDYSKISMFKSGTFWDTEVWYASVLFAHPDILRAGGRLNTSGEVAEGIYAMLDETWTRIFENACDAVRHGFKEHLCSFGMGEHFFYKVSSDTNGCESYQPFFALYYNRQIYGFGIAPFGSFTSKPTGKRWFESFTEDNMRMWDNAPQCFWDWSKHYDLTSLHVFLQPRSRFTTCSFFSLDPCAYEE